MNYKKILWFFVKEVFIRAHEAGTSIDVWPCCIHNINRHFRGQFIYKRNLQENFDFCQLQAQHSTQFEMYLLLVQKNYTAWNKN